MANEILLEGFDLGDWNLEENKPNPQDSNAAEDKTPEEGSADPEPNNDGESNQLAANAEPVTEPLDEEGETELSEEEEEARIDYVNNHFNYLKQENLLLLPEDYKFEGDIEEAYRLDVQQRQEAVANNLVNKMPDELKSIVQYGLAAASDGFEIDYNDLLSSASSVDYLKSLDFASSEETAEDFLLTYYTEQVGLKETAARGAIERHKDEGDLLETATQFRDAAVTEFEDDLKDRQDELDRQARNKAKLQNQFNSQVSKIVDSQKWDLPVRSTIKQDIFNGVMASKIENLLTKDPNGLVQLARFLSAYDLKKGFSNNVVDKRTQAQAAKKVKDNFFQAVSSPKTTTSKPRRKKDKFDLSDIQSIQF